MLWMGVGRWESNGQWVGNKVQKLSKVCLYKKFVHWLSMYKVHPLTVHIQRLPIVCQELCHHNWSRNEILIIVQSLSNSNVCPKYNILASEHSTLDKVWTHSGLLSPISVHPACYWTGALQTLYFIGQRVDRACTLYFIWQIFDRVWTEIGQRLDFVSNLCPTNRWLGVLAFVLV